MCTCFYKYSEDLGHMLYLEHISFSFCGCVPSFVFICFSLIFDILDLLHLVMGLNISMVVILYLICTLFLVLLITWQIVGPFSLTRNISQGRWKLEERAKDELLVQAASLRKEREQIEDSVKVKEDTIKLKAENNLIKYKDDIQKLEKEISVLRLKTDSSRIAALKRGIDGSYASRLTDTRNSTDHKESWSPIVSDSMKGLYEYSGTGGVKRERECVMCLSEEMSVVFLPCAHQVVCTTCNELHEKQGMKDCPSCRSPIQRRIPVRYARS